MIDIIYFFYLKEKLIYFYGAQVQCRSNAGPFPIHNGDHHGTISPQQANDIS